MSDAVKLDFEIGVCRELGLDPRETARTWVKERRRGKDDFYEDERSLEALLAEWAVLAADAEKQRIEAARRKRGRKGA